MFSANEGVDKVIMYWYYKDGNFDSASDNDHNTYPDYIKDDRRYDYNNPDEGYDNNNIRKWNSYINITTSQ